MGKQVTDINGCKRIIGQCKSVIYARCNRDDPRYDETFPPPFKMGNSSRNYWVVAELEQWVEQQIAKSRESS